MDQSENFLLQILNTEFQRNVDDTLVNRLVKSLMCNSNDHSAIWTKLSPTFLDSIFNLINVNQKTSYERKIFIKLIFSLLLRYKLQFGSFNTSVFGSLKFSFSDSLLLNTTIHSFASVLQYIRCFDDLLSTPWICDDEVSNIIFNHLSLNNTIYRFDDEIYILAHYLFVKVQNGNLDTSVNYIYECLHLTELGIEILLSYSIVCDKMFASNCFTILPVKPFTVEHFKQFSMEVQANLLYLLCSDIIKSTSDTQSWIQLFSTLHNFPLICLYVLKVYVKFDKQHFGLLYNYVRRAWLDHLLSVIEKADKKMVRKMIIPVVLSINKQNPIELDDTVLAVIFDKVFDNFIEACDLNEHTYRSNLLSLMNVIIKISHQSHFQYNFSKIWNYLKKHYACENSTGMMKEVRELLDFIVTCIIKLDTNGSDVTEHVTTFLKISLHSTLHHDAFICFLLAFLRLLKHLSPSTINNSIITSVWSYVFNILLHSSLWDSSVQDSYNDVINEIMCNLLHYLSNYSFLTLWTLEIRQLFGQFVNNVFNLIPESNLLCNVDLRSLIISSFIVLLLSAHRDNDYLESTEDMLKLLIDFDWMELTISKMYSKTLWTNIQHMAKESKNGPQDQITKYYSSIWTKWITQLGEEYSTMLENNEPYCATCKENIEELIEQIILDGKSNLQIDCTEG